jgi:hypothetical protein
MAIYTARVVKDGRTLSRKQISEGLGRTDAVVLKAQAGAHYVLGEAAAQAAPGKITAKRVGQNLHLSLERGHPDVPDLVIEGYFDYPPAQVAGINADGIYAAYDLPVLAAAGAGTGVVASGSVMQASLPEVAPSFAGMGMMGWGLVGLGGVLALSGGGGSSPSAATSTAPATAADAAVTALAKIADYAADGTKAKPVLKDYTDAAIVGVVGGTGTTANLEAINSAVDALSADKVNTKDVLQGVVDAYIKILDEANGVSQTDGTPNVDPQAADYAKIGANIGLAKENINALTLLNDVIGPVGTTSGLDRSAVNTIAKINALALVVDKIMLTAAGLPAGADPATMPKFTVDDFYLLGLANTSSATLSAISTANLAAVVNAITGVGQNALKTFAQLNTLTNAAATIASYADDKSAAVPTFAHYTAIFNDPAVANKVTQANFNMINSAVEALTADKVDSKIKLQAVVDTYLKLIKEANGALPNNVSDNPTAQDFATIGAVIGKAAAGTAAGTNLDSSALKLLDNVIAGLPSSTSIDTIGKINDLGAAVDKVMSLAQKDTGATAGATVLTMDDLKLLGVTNTNFADTTAEKNGIAQDIIDSSNAGLDVQTVAALQAFVDARIAIDPLAKIAAYTYNPADTKNKPLMTDYNEAGIKNVTQFGNFDAVNSAVDALASDKADTKDKVQAVVDVYTKILAEADGNANQNPADFTPSAADFATIGASIGLASTGTLAGSTINSNALTLLGDAIGVLSTGAVDSINEINRLAAIVDRVMNLAALPTGSALVGSASSLLADLKMLGVNNTDRADTQAEQNLVMQAIINSVDTGYGVRMISDLQAIVTSNAG